MRARPWHVIGLLLLLALAARAGPTERLAFPLSGGLMVPPTDSPASGSADLLLDLETASLGGFIVFEHLQGALTAMQFHGPAAASERGPLLFDLGTTRHVLIGGLTHVQIRELQLEQWYVEVHTTAYADGEVRGQIRHASPALAGATWAAVKALFR